MRIFDEFRNGSISASLEVLTCIKDSPEIVFVIVLGFNAEFF